MSDHKTVAIYNVIKDKLRIYKTPTSEKILSFKRAETCPVYTKRCILWI